MERLGKKLQTAKAALASLKELAGKKPGSLIHRDAAIQRFEYTFEAVWKTAKVYLKEVEGVDAGTPKGVVRACMRAGVLDENQTRTALEMVDDRNLTSHTYDEGLAQMIFSRLSAHAKLLDLWLAGIEARMGE